MRASRTSAIWATLAGLPMLYAQEVPHEHVRVGTNKCPTHQTLIANARAHGLRLHVFHDRDHRLYVVKLPDNGKEGRGKLA